MQLISSDIAENESVTTKDENMESLERHVVVKENLESYVDIPSFGDTNGIESSKNEEEPTENGDEAMDVDDPPVVEEALSTEDISKDTEQETLILNGGENDSVLVAETGESVPVEVNNTETCNTVLIPETSENIVVEEEEKKAETAEIVSIPESVESISVKEADKTEDIADICSDDVDSTSKALEETQEILKDAVIVDNAESLMEVESKVEAVDNGKESNEIGEIDDASVTNLETDIEKTLSKEDNEPTNIYNSVVNDDNAPEATEKTNSENEKDLDINKTDLNSSNASSVDVMTEELLLKDDIEPITLMLSPGVNENDLLKDVQEEDLSESIDAGQLNNDTDILEVCNGDKIMESSEISDKSDAIETSKTVEKSNEDCEILNPSCENDDINSKSPDSLNNKEINTIVSDNKIESDSLDYKDTRGNDSIDCDASKNIENAESLENTKAEVDAGDKNKVSDIVTLNDVEKSDVDMQSQTSSSAVSDVTNAKTDDEKLPSEAVVSNISICKVENDDEFELNTLNKSRSCDILNTDSDSGNIKEENSTIATADIKSEVNTEENSNHDKVVDMEKPELSSQELKTEITHPEDVTDKEVTPNETLIVSKESTTTDEIVIVNKESEVKIESMIVSSDDESVVVDPKFESKKNTEQAAEEMEVQEEVGDSTGVKNDSNSNEKDSPVEKSQESKPETKESVCLSVDDDDDDIVVIDDSSSKTSDSKKVAGNDAPSKTPDILLTSKTPESNIHADLTDKTAEKKAKPDIPEAPLCPLTIMKTLKPALDSMSREDLEEFIVVKIVESISGRSAISDLQLKLKVQEKSMEEWRKKVMTLSKQNKDLTIVLRNVCDEQQKRLKENPLPIKITRSVGLQVGYPSIKTPVPIPGNVTMNSPYNTDNSANINNAKQAPKPSPPKLPVPVANSILRPQSQPNTRRKSRGATTPTQNLSTTPPALTPIVPPTPPQVPANSPTTTPTPHITVNRARRSNTPIVPKLIPASQAPVPVATTTKSTISPRATANILKPFPDAPKAEKRAAVQSIDLTDDEPPSKIQAVRTPPRPTPTIRPVNTNQLTNANKVTYVVNSSSGTGSRQVYIPINAQGQNVQSNSLLVGGKVLNKVTIPNMRQLPPAIRIGQPIPIRPVGMQHPAPLPQSINSKAQLHPSWKWIPPRPTLKIARVENGIVISWEMSNFSEAQHEPIASYQIFAYQEASSQPTTDLWKKIGDVKALPLPMACTLTHFMAGFKYYFAVRAIDIRTRVGPFSAPGQITLLNNKK